MGRNIGNVRSRTQELGGRVEPSVMKSGGIPAHVEGQGRQDALFSASGTIETGFRIVLTKYAHEMSLQVVFPGFWLFLNDLEGPHLEGLRPSEI